MKVLFFLSYFRDQASSRVRGFYMAEELRSEGINCDIIYGYGKKVYVNFLARLLRYDIIYFQKRYSKRGLYLNKIARLLGKKTLFDIDDAPGGIKLSIKAEKQAVEMIRTSSAVIVGSHKLKDLAQNFNNHVYIIPSSIYLSYYKPKREMRDRGYITLGWIGNGIVYKDDLQMLIKPIENIGEKYDIKLTIVGALEQKEIHQSFGMMKNVEVRIIDSIDWADPIAVPSLISDFDIGLYPLLNNEYNKYKCGFKALEYMAMEVPVIASPVGENKIVINAGRDGFLALNTKEWEENISYLIENEVIRKRMGKLGRKKVEENYSTEVCVHKLIAVFKEIGR